MFNRRTWLARIGTGLNKFIIGAKDADGKQALVNSPDTVTQEGDVISADNLNDLEGRIESEFNNKVNLSSTINDRTLSAPVFLFDWDIYRGNLAINDLSAFEESTILVATEAQSGPSAMSGDETLTLPDMAVGELLKYRFARRKEDPDYTTVRTLTVKVPSTGVYIGRWTRRSGAWRNRATERERIVLLSLYSPTYTPTVETATFSEEALLHIIKEDYGGYKDKARGMFTTNNPITFATDISNYESTASGRINVNGGATLGTLGITGMQDSSDYDCPYAGITCSLWLYRVE